MKKLIYCFILNIFLTCPAFCANQSSFNVNNNSFIDFGRYVETFQINDDSAEDINNTDNLNEDFEINSASDVAERYEDNAVELKLDDINDSALSDINSQRIYKLKVNKTQYNLEKQIKAENMIWDSSKAFSFAFFNDSRHMAPIPGVVNSQSINAQISPELKASLGQTFLFDSLGPSVLFVRTNESTYNTGSVISYKGNSLNLALGSFSSSFNNAASGGAILTSKPLRLPANSGKILFGSAFFANEGQGSDKTTGGLFTEYSFKRLKLSAQIAQSKFSNSNYFDTGVYFIPEFRLSDSLSVKTRFIRNVTSDIMQDELALTYSPKKNKNNLEFEINASNQYDANSTIKQRLKLSTSFKI